MKKKTLLLLFAIFMAGATFSQQKWNLKANAGATSGSSAIDGYYFSFDLGIPISRSFELAPTFTSANMLPNTFIYNSWNRATDVANYAVPSGGPRQEQEYGDLLSSVALLLIYKPMILYDSNHQIKQELYLGTGLSYNSYTMVSSRYYISETNYRMDAFSVKSNQSLEIYYLKVGYNYFLNKNLFLGFVASLPGYDGEAELLAGFQFGVRF